MKTQLSLEEAQLEVSNLDMEMHTVKDAMKVVAGPQRGALQRTLKRLMVLRDEAIAERDGMDNTPLSPTTMNVYQNGILQELQNEHGHDLINALRLVEANRVLIINCSTKGNSVQWTARLIHNQLN